ncbi:MAG: hypothetical protein AAGA96_10290, partial [Verrucomicrobiota bacterium]
MNPEDFSRNDLWGSPDSVILIGLFLFSTLIWLGFNAWAKRYAVPWRLIAGFALATLSLWIGFQCLGRFLALASSWPLLGIAATGGIMLQGIHMLYAFERDLVSRCKGRLLLALRCAGLITVLLILLQPVRTFLETREMNREVAILIDESDSMLLDDRRLTATERLDRATLLQIEGISERPPWQSFSQNLREMDRALAEEEAAFKSAPSPRANLESRRLPIEALMASLTSDTEYLSSMLEQARASSFSLFERVNEYQEAATQISKAISQADAAISQENGDAVLKQIGVARAELRSINNSILTTTNEADSDFYRSLPNEVRRQVDDAAERSRLDLAIEALSAPLPSSPDQLNEIPLTLLGALE